MAQEFTIQCPKCGTYYNDLQDVCPYCGEPQPAAELAALPDEYLLAPEPPANYLPAAEDAFYHTGFEDEGEPFADDDIFAVAGDLPEPGYPPPAYDSYDDSYDYPPAPPADTSFGAVGRPDASALPDELTDYGQFAAPYSAAELADEAEQLPEDEAAEFEPAAPARRFRFRRVALGCLGLLLCGGLFYGTLGVLAVRSGLQERAMLAQTEAQTRYQRGQELLAAKSIDLAIAEFERAVKLDPNLREARQALREAQRQAQEQPTPTSQTRSAAAAENFSKAEELFKAENWPEAVQILAQVRDLDANYQAGRVADMLFEANYKLGMQLISPDKISEALAAFEQALVARPDDPQATVERTKAALYVKGMADLATDKLSAIKSFSQLYRTAPKYLDTAQQLQQAYVAYGDALTGEKEWCLAQDQYTEANKLAASPALQSKIETTSQQCREKSPVAAASQPAAVQPGVAITSPITGSVTAITTTGAITSPATTTTTTVAAAPAPATGGSTAAGNIIYSVFNPDEKRWEVLSIPASGSGSPKLLAANATMPALSPNGQILLYRSEDQASEGLHALNLTTGEDVRATIFRQYVLPRWGGENLPFVFNAKDPATGRWQFFEGFADGKSNPIVLGDGRTPAWSPNGKTIAYQGTDPEGNQPGIYLLPFGGGETTRLTSHESDRSPAFSPDGSRIAYMSTQNGNWDIYVVSVSGGQPTQVTTAPGNDGLPVWSPDGTQLAFVSDAGGSWAIHTVSAGGGKPAKVVDWSNTRREDWLMDQIGWGR